MRWERPGTQGFSKPSRGPHFLSESKKEGLRQHQLVPSVEGEVGHREDYRAQLPGRWGPASPRFPLPVTSAQAPTPPPPLGQDDKRLEPNQHTQDRTECPLGRAGVEAPAPPTSWEGREGGSLALSTPCQAREVFALCSPKGQSPPHSLSVCGGATGVLGSEVDATPRSGLWFLGRDSLPSQRPASLGWVTRQELEA